MHFLLKVVVPLTLVGGIATAALFTPASVAEQQSRKKEKSSKTEKKQEKSDQESRVEASSSPTSTEDSAAPGPAAPASPPTPASTEGASNGEQGTEDSSGKSS